MSPRGFGVEMVVEQTFEYFSLNGKTPSSDPSLPTPGLVPKITVEPAPRPDGKKGLLYSSIVLCDDKVNPKGLFSSEEVTSYRTSMKVTVPFSWRKHVGHVIIFGSGMQALRNTRLILMLRASEVRSITYVSPVRDQAKQLIATKLELRLRNINCICCTTSSKKPLFPASYVANKGSRCPLISAIGSWKSDMIELDPELLRLAVQPNAGYNPIIGKDDGVILVDDRDFALTNSGEFVESRMNTKDVIERGEILTLRSGKLSSVSLTDKVVEKTDRFCS
ncbi:hypothetical protein BDV33DRAFT_199489 [Aspergillus novoparasiticus]|uniref:Uncharacterized protein n=1 Tax=Aspergillus novoparasiticus TaxID=986946 RepID=A0A5N6F6T4_9EURO|nr:hypothetical protein BDV33DRAFT_199489 [Aspergillus novoparasiticus]